MTLVQLLVVYRPEDIASLSFNAEGAILAVTLHKPAASKSDASKPSEEGKPVKLRATSDVSLAGPLPLHVID